MGELLNTSTTTPLRSIFGPSDFGRCFGFGGEYDEWDAAGLWVAEAGATCRSVGAGLRVVTHATPAIATARMLRMTTGEGNTTPRWSRASTSDLETEAPGRAHTLALRPHPAEAADQQGILGQGLGTVDQGVEHLVVAGRRHVEGLADRGLLGAGILPPLPLEL